MHVARARRAQLKKQGHDSPGKHCNLQANERPDLSCPPIVKIAAAGAFPAFAARAKAHRALSRLRQAFPELRAMCSEQRRRTAALQRPPSRLQEQGAKSSRSPFALRLPCRITCTTCKASPVQRHVLVRTEYCKCVQQQSGHSGSSGGS
jgi:hypothetical protein